jgi:hypothetical protein
MRVRVLIWLAPCLSCTTQGSGSVSTSCDPLAATSTALGVILGVGQDAQGTLYVADELEPSSGRVFVANGDTLYRKHVSGSGQSGTGPDRDYTFTFGDPGGDAQAARALLVQIRGGNTTAMALGPAGSRTFIGDGLGQVRIPLVDPTVVDRMRVVNLPRVVQRIGDVANGDVIAVTQPMDDSASESNLRLFYGAPHTVIERHIVSYGSSLSGDADFSFLVGDIKAVAFFPWGPQADGGLGGGPGTLTLGTTATLPLTPRHPTPRDLSGLALQCSAGNGG